MISTMRKNYHKILNIVWTYAAPGRLKILCRMKIGMKCDSHYCLFLHRCDMKYVLLEMDRILRPAGYAIIRESSYFMDAISTIARGMRWSCRGEDTEYGVEKEKILICQKKLWHSSNQSSRWQTWEILKLAAPRAYATAIQDCRGRKLNTLRRLVYSKEAKDPPDQHLSWRISYPIT